MIDGEKRMYACYGCNNQLIAKPDSLCQGCEREQKIEKICKPFSYFAKVAWPILATHVILKFIEYTLPAEFLEALSNAQTDIWNLWLSCFGLSDSSSSWSFWYTIAVVFFANVQLVGLAVHSWLQYEGKGYFYAYNDRQTYFYMILPWLVSFFVGFLWEFQWQLVSLMLKELFWIIVVFILIPVLSRINGKYREIFN